MDNSEIPSSPSSNASSDSSSRASSPASSNTSISSNAGIAPIATGAAPIAAAPIATARDGQRPIVYNGVILGYAQRPVLHCTEEGFQRLLNDFMGFKAHSKADQVRGGI
ncbi:hypothetical protein EAE96_010887 [Botrytis aclada]|nr:hypothetical protein EAE96_010887 [Botrytis aclada]